MCTAHVGTAAAKAATPSKMPSPRQVITGPSCAAVRATPVTGALPARTRRPSDIESTYALRPAASWATFASGEYEVDTDGTRTWKLADDLARYRAIIEATEARGHR